MKLLPRWVFVAVGVGFLLGGCSASPYFPSLPAELIAEPLVAIEDGVQPEQETTSVVSAYMAPERTGTTAREDIDFFITKYATAYNVPERLVHRVVNRESTYRSHARNGIHMGLMQLNPATARTMGYRGDNLGLLDAETNLKYGVKYLAGAYLVAKGNEERADKLYQTGYYYQAKRMGLLRETGLRP